MKLRPATLLLVLLSLPAVRGAAGQRVGPVYGVVRNEFGSPLARVEIVLADSGARTVTDDSGAFVLTRALVGRVHFTARRVGYVPVDTMLELKENENKQLIIQLDAIAATLDSVVVHGRRTSARMAEFWNRKELGVGAFITPEQLAQRRPYRTSDMLRSIPGVRVGNDNTNGRPTIAMGRIPVAAGGQAFSADCRVNYYVDGAWVPPGTFHLDDITPTAIEAIEIYRGPAETPARFRQRETACGLIVVWTKEPPPRK
jgi:hypothetical protein